MVYMMKMTNLLQMFHKNLIILLFMLYGCYATNDPWEAYPKEKLTQDEKEYIKGLQRQGYGKKIRIEKDLIGQNPEGYSSYYLYIDSIFNFNSRNKDSIYSIQKSLAIKLYAEVIENSRIYDCSDYCIEFKFSDEKKVTGNIQFYVNHNYCFHKDSLQKWCGFKVIKDKFKKYKRIKI